MKCYVGLRKPKNMISLRKLQFSIVPSFYFNYAFKSMHNLRLASDNFMDFALLHCPRWVNSLYVPVQETDHSWQRGRWVGKPLYGSRRWKTHPGTLSWLNSFWFINIWPVGHSCVLKKVRKRPCQLFWLEGNPLGGSHWYLAILNLGKQRCCKTRPRWL